jgi:hypothetical protein
MLGSPLVVGVVANQATLKGDLCDQGLVRFLSDKSESIKVRIGSKLVTTDGLSHD